MRLELSAVGMSYPGRALFTGVCAAVPSKSLAMVVGPSGSGKSTLLAALAGLTPVESGTIRWIDSHGGARAPDPGVVAWVQQAATALSGRSVLDNVAIAAMSHGLSRRSAEDRADRALTQVRLGAQRDALAARLSGGELQRLALARAVVTDRPVILADEPTANLDAENTSVVAETLTRLARARTVIVATHDSALMSRASVVIALRGTDAPA